MFRKGVLFVLALFFAAGCDRAGGLFGHPPTTWHVKVGGAGSQDGSSWDNAMSHPQDAVNSAQYGDEIWVAQGTYRRVGVWAVLGMKDGVRVYGGFAGDESSFYEREWWANETILDAESACWHVVFGEDDARLDGFTITGGNASGGGEEEYGGGMYNNRARNLIVTNCIFRNNYGARAGGAIYNQDSSVTVKNCVFYSNSTGGDGGGMCVQCTEGRASTEIVNCTFYGNNANRGGAIKLSGGDLIVTNSILWEDTAPEGPEIFDESGVYSDVTYSCIWNGWPDAGNIGSDPMFVDASVGNLHLQSSSPCIDTGTASGAPDHDLDGNERPRGSGYDMGAYEY